LIPGGKQSIRDLEVECGESSVNRVMASIGEHSMLSRITSHLGGCKQMYRSKNELNTYDFDTKGGRKQSIRDLEVECGESSVNRVIASIGEHSNVQNNFEIKI
jgi:hypothetical protein